MQTAWSGFVFFGFCYLCPDLLLKVFDVELASQVVSIRTDCPVRCFKFNGETLIGGDEHGAVRVFNIVSALEVAAYHEHSGAVRSMAISADGRTLVTGGDDRNLVQWTLS
eukprot:m.599035 g.599035  ORF g.599035 m.599035 type:complete len:110 (-) comp58076_c0_seq54:1404-1733(-)